MNAGGGGEPTVTGLLAWRAAETPQAAAFQQEREPGHWVPISWQNFHARAMALRSALHAAGLRKGNRLAVLAPVSLEWELLHHAALSLGVVVVGLDTHDLPERLGLMAEQAGIVAFATTDLRVLRGVAPARLSAARLVLRIGGPDAVLPAGTRVTDWSALQVHSTGPDAVGTDCDPLADDLATVIFTSGTTGAPKGIAYSHRQLRLAIDGICDAFSFVGAHSRLLCWLPLSNLFQRIVNLAGLRQGACIYLLSDPRRVMDAVAVVSPDVFVGVPRFYEKLHDGLRRNIDAQPRLRRTLVNWAWDVGCRCAEHQRAGRRVPATLRLRHSVAERWVLHRVRQIMGTRLHCMVSGSAPMPVHLLEAFHGLGWLVLEAYGSSENVLPMAMNRLDRYRFGTVGMPLAGNRIRLNDAGVVQVKGAGVFGGYLGDSAGEVFDAEGYYTTGDIGSLDGDGFLRLLGRTGDLIKTSTGKRVAPPAVEARLCAVSGVDQALLVGDGRKALAVICTLDRSLPDDAAFQRLVQALQAAVLQLNAFEKPVGVLLLAQPFSIEAGDLTPNLKLRRKAVAERHAESLQRLYDAVDRSSSGGLLVMRDQLGAD